MDSGDLQMEISRLEGEIEELTHVVERCRKIILVAKLTLAVGGIWLLLLVVGGARAEPIGLIGALAAVIGGTVVFGSNTSTLKEAASAIKFAEVRRSELIGRLDLQTLGD
jgi:hypothetical protein